MLENFLTNNEMYSLIGVFFYDIIYGRRNDKDEE